MSLELNKIAAAVLVAGLTAMVVSKGTQLFYDGAEHGHGEHEAKRGYTIAGAEEASEGGAAKVDAGPVDISLFLASADPAQGEKIAKACVSCHKFDKGAGNGIGPELWGIVGAPKGHRSDFPYSGGMKEKGGNWDFQSLSEFLTKPKDYISGTKMSYIGLKKPEERAALIRYLNEHSDKPLEIPEPPAQEEAKPEEKAETTPVKQPEAAVIGKNAPGDKKTEAETTEKTPAQLNAAKPAAAKPAVATVKKAVAPKKVTVKKPVASRPAAQAEKPVSRPASAPRSRPATNYRPPAQQRNLPWN